MNFVDEQRRRGSRLVSSAGDVANHSSTGPEVWRRLTPIDGDDMGQRGFTQTGRTGNSKHMVQGLGAGTGGLDENLNCSHGLLADVLVQLSSGGRPGPESGVTAAGGRGNQTVGRVRGAVESMRWRNWRAYREFGWKFKTKREQTRWSANDHGGISGGRWIVAPTG